MRHGDRQFRLQTEKDGKRQAMLSELCGQICKSRFPYTMVLYGNEVFPIFEKCSVRPTVSEPIQSLFRAYLEPIQSVFREPVLLQFGAYLGTVSSPGHLVYP